MSYVLDALRRADAERSHGLASPLMPPASSGPSRGAARRGTARRRAPWLLGASLALLALWLILRWTTPDAPAQNLPDGDEPASETSAQAAAAHPAARQPVPAAAGSTAATEAGGPVELAPASAQTSASASARAQPVPNPMPAGALAEAEAEAAAGGLAQPLLRPEASAASNFPAPRPRLSAGAPGPSDEGPADAPEGDLPTAALPRPVLPQDGAQAARNLQPRAPLVRPSAAPASAGLASLPGRPDARVSGATYSENPEHRMLIVNGQVVHEGGEVSPGHVLEAIGQRSAVINHQGTRYNINY